MFERLSAGLDGTLTLFNTTNTANSRDNRSDDKSTEPEQHDHDLGSRVTVLYSRRTSPRRVATFTASVRLVTPSFSNR
jgi:hypothetical protein